MIIDKHVLMWIILQIENGTVVVVIVWKLDLQLPIQPLLILTIAVSSNPAHGEVYSILLYVLSVTCGRWLVFSG